MTANDLRGPSTLDSHDQHTAVVERIRTDMVRGDYAPHQRLVEADLCERYNASRGSVRVALRELAVSGLVELQRNRGARVRAVPLREAIEITEARMVLESLAARKAAEQATEAEARELRDIGARMRAAVANGELLVYSELNAVLHRRVREIADHKTAAELVERLGAQVVRHQFRLSLQPGRPSVSLPQHEAIIAAVAGGDPDAAEAAMRAHLSSVLTALHAIGDEQG